MSEEKKVEKKDENVAAGPVKVEEKKKKSGVLSLVAVVLGCFLLVAVVLIFLNGLKLDKQVLELEHQLVILQTGEKEMGQRVLALEDEFVVMGLKHNLKKISQSRKNLEDLKVLFADNPEMADKVQALADDLVTEQKRLEGQISGSTHGAFKGSRSLQPSAAYPPCLTNRCEGGRCFIAPDGAHPPCLEVVPVPGHAAIEAGPGHSRSKAETAEPKPQSGWSKFINLRLFGN